MDEKKLKKVQAAVRLGVNPTDALLLQKLIDVEELAVKLEQLLSGIDTGKLEYIKGDDGYTPIKGTDYVDGEDGYTPVKGKDYFDGEDGKTPTKDELVALIKPLIEKPEQVDTTALVKQVLDQVEVPEIDQKGILDALTAQIPQLGMSVRDALELLPEGEKLLTSSIEDKDGKNLDIIIEELKKQTGKTVFAGGGARAANQISLDTTNFAGNLSAADDTVQKALDTLDDMVGGGGGTWGSITGTLSNQTDLQSALDAKAASSHTHTASQITDFDTEVSNNTDVAANTAARHDAVTVTDSAEIDFTLIGQDITASLKAGSIDVLKLDSGVQTSLGLADSALQNIVEDTTPQLGGNLDTQGNTILGGTSTTADLILQTTSGVGATGADMHFKVGNNGATEAMTILNSGNVGIGTTGPAGKLQVYNGNILVFNTATNPASSGAVNGLSLGFDGNLEHGWIQAVRNNVGEIRDLEIQPLGGNIGIGTTTIGARLTIQGSGATSATKNLSLLNSAGTEMVTVLNNGNVGIGTTGPNALIAVSTNRVTALPTEVQAIINTNFGGTNGTGGRDTLILANGGTDPTTTIQGAALSFKAPTYGSTGSWSSGRILSYFDTSGGSNPGYGGAILAFQYPTADNTFATGMVLKNGNVGIGTTAPDYKLDINGALGLRATTTPADPDSGAGVVYMDSTTGDLMTKLNFGGTTKTVTLVDWSVV